MWMKPRVLFFVSLSFVCFCCAVTSLSQTERPGEKKLQTGSTSSSAAKTAALPSEDSQYVGSDTCKTCHEDLYNNWAKTPHWKTMLDKKASPSHQGCEGCHGPGADHVAGGGDKTKIFIFEKASATEVNTRCLTCHVGTHPNFERSAHGHAKVSCIDCHSPHAFKSEANLLKVAQPQLCYGCHTDVKPAFSQPFHHKVNEGVLVCSDCHDPHGTFKRAQLRATADQNAICTKCHAETAGPFVFEHPVIKAEGCVACHTPHGSPNPRLLNVSNLNILCLQCHSPSPNYTTGLPIGPAHNQNQQYQSCTICHTSIHGSNISPVFFNSK